MLAIVMTALFVAAAPAEDDVAEVLDLQEVTCSEDKCEQEVVFQDAADEDKPVEENAG